MNNKGQTLVLFVVLIPFILALFAFVIDSAYIVKEDTKLKSIATSSLKSLNDNKNISDIKKIIKTNDNNIQIVVIDNNKIHLTNQIDPIFGKIVGYEKYNLDIELYSTFENGKLVIKEKGK